MKKPRLTEGDRLRIEEVCARLSRPIVCNGCPRQSKCVLRKRFYIHAAAQTNYREQLVETRRGANITEEEVLKFDATLYELTAQGQSIHAVMASHADCFTDNKKTAIEFQIAGDGEEDYGWLALRNTALELQGGTLRISLVNGHKPVRKTTYQLFDWSDGGNMSGSFDAVELPEYGDWRLDDLYVDGTVTIVPNVGTMLLIR